MRTVFSGFVVVTLLAALLVSSAVFAQLPPMPFSSEAPRRVDGQIVASALALPSEHSNRTAARRQAAESAERRARQSLVLFVDAAMSRSRVRPALASRTHRILRNETMAAGQRPLVDGSVVVRVSVPLAVLDRGAGLELDWGSR